MSPGRPLTYKPEIHLQKLLDGLEATYSINQAAAHACIPRSTLQGWLKIGDQDFANNNQSFLAHLSAAFRELQAILAAKLIKDGLRKRHNSMERWILEACYRKDYGHDVQTEECQEFLNKIREDLNVLKQVKIKEESNV